MHNIKIILSIIFLTLMGISVRGQTKGTDIRFKSPCFKAITKIRKNINNDLVKGYDCELVFIPDVGTYSSKTGKIYYRDWWNLFLARQGNYINLYPLKENDAAAHISINQVTNRSKVLYLGETQTINRRDFDIKYDTDQWQIDTIFQKIKIIHDRTFIYNTELVTILRMEGWNLYVPLNCKTVEGYGLIYSNQRGFIGSYVYFFSKKDGTKAISYHFIGDQKLRQFMNKKHIINYFGPGIWWECDK